MNLLGSQHNKVTNVQIDTSVFTFLGSYKGIYDIYVSMWDPSCGELLITLINWNSKHGFNNYVEVVINKRTNATDLQSMLLRIGYKQRTIDVIIEGYRRCLEYNLFDVLYEETFNPGNLPPSEHELTTTNYDLPAV